MRYLQIKTGKLNLRNLKSLLYWKLLYEKEAADAASANAETGLNPYYTGSYSMSNACQCSYECIHCLNPYYTGSYSMSCSRRLVLVYLGIVLILIILEVTL